MIEINKLPSLIILIASISSCLIAQSLKILINLIRFQKFDFGILVRTGGMPSSHSAMVTSLVTATGIIDGWQSTSFALAACFALIVMYDASGVRRSVGIQATILNQMIVEFNNDNPELQFKRIKEFLGHTPVEVLVGAFLGIVLGFSICAIVGIL
ncbi:MAG: divergent PAP2 family protein [Candidatus Caenarcaniphilales bacterium]|nr:divergent PAP2 family protein [Candidatus Caenarcaniphilales bacterium]